ncbi:hypothetical protein FAZ69_22250 [Trinickia terrae]|uniref:Uncharacterized protein n=1 Tax=Trinickia terrae TaxID=2571161 RepID=A0A4U1HZ25_9BURK|nr:hypothetical protein [Trinickia terrae]TKC86028.1 hypothetical protein FAZ69_22250 [Trinickia terrae]
MQDELNQLHDVASKLLGNHLGTWADSLMNATAGHDDNKALSVLHSLLAVRSALAPLVGSQQDTSHG